jgi:signal transduction histidine kinase
VTHSDADGTHPRARQSWNFGVRARLLLAFVGIAAFAALAAAAGIYAFHEVGGRLAAIDARVAPTLSALELSRSAERIIAAAPALLAATGRGRSDEVNAQLTAEIERLKAALVGLKLEQRQALPLDAIESLVSLLTASLTELHRLSASRLESSERIAALRRDLFDISAEAQRLLGPWLDVTDSEISANVRSRLPSSPADGDEEQLQSLVQLQRAIREAQRQFSGAVDMLAEASTAEQAKRLPVLTFQLGLALRDLEESSSGLPPKLRQVFAALLTRLRHLVEGPNAIARARSRELATLAEGVGRLATTADLSAQLSAAVDQLGRAAGQDIGTAVEDAVSVQRFSTRVLFALVALSLLSSLLLVWLYVGRNIVRRITALSASLRAIATGGLQAPVAAEGTDEIAAMGRAVEVFRQNTLERDRLLAEKAQTAELLEQQVQQRTAELAQLFEEVRDKSRQLELANNHKSNFLAAASHDLRQPLHALNLFVAQLRTEADPTERARLVERVEAAIASMNELFDALLDMTKLEAGILQPNPVSFPADRLLRRLETTFADAARQKQLRLKIVPSTAWLRSDFVLLERMLLNLVSNAVRHTQRGGVVVGCRRRGEQLRIDVCDSGPGIPDEQRRNVFAEFYQLPQSDHHAGLGLGLAIVDRLARLLGHAVELHSSPGRGSRFSVWVRQAPAVGDGEETSVLPALADPARGKLVLLVDDEPLVIDGMVRLLRSWGCEVLHADTAATALRLVTEGQQPDLVVADYHLADGKTGIEAIEAVRCASGVATPAFLVTGDTTPPRLHEARAAGYVLLHKPVPAIRLRAVVNQLLASVAPRAAE